MTDLTPEEAEEAITFEPEPASDAMVAEMVRQLKETREQIARLKKDEAVLRQGLLPCLDQRGGHFTDEVSGLTARLKTQQRYEWDANRLRATGELKDAEIASVMDSVVNKKKLEALILTTGARERLLAPAKVMTSSHEIVSITERGK